jgi:Domain of Unknown Function (DUF1206)
MITNLDRILRFRPEVEEDASQSASSATKVEQGAQRVRTSPLFQWIARVGLLSRAVVYVVLGALILEIAVKGRASSRADSEGAFSEIARQPAGREILALLATGLAAYALWRFVETVSSQPQGQQVSAWARIGWLTVGVLYVGLCVNVVKIILGSPAKQGPEQHPSSFAASVLQLPLGPELLGLVAAAVVVGGIVLIVWGAIHDYGKSLQTARMSPGVRKLARWSGILGNAARGVAVLMVGSSLFVSAVSDNPNRAKALDTALQGVANGAVGKVLLVAVGVGFVIFATHSIVEARFRRV